MAYIQNRNNKFNKKKKKGLLSIDIPVQNSDITAQPNKGEKKTKKLAKKGRNRRLPPVLHSTSDRSQCRVSLKKISPPLGMENIPPSPLPLFFVFVSYFGFPNGGEYDERELRPPPRMNSYRRRRVSFSIE